MNRFGLPLVPSALALWAINFIDRLFVGALQGHRRGRRLLARGARVERDRLPDDRVPARVARVRVLDRGRVRGEADVRVRAHVPALRLLLDLARARRARAVARAGSSRRRARPSTAPTRRSALLAFARDARTPATPCSRSGSAARGGRSSTGSSAASPRSLNIALNFALIPPLRDDGRRGLDGRRLRRAVRRDDAQRAAASTRCRTSGAAC